MSRLIWTEIKRYLISPYFLGSIFLLLVLNSNPSTGWIPILSNLFFWGDTFMYNNSILAILLSLMITAYIYADFLTGTLHSKLILGYNKSQLLIATAISCGLGSGLLVAVESTIYVLKKIYNKENLILPMNSIMINTVIFMSSLACIAIIISIFCLILPKHILTPVFLVCFSIFMMQHGTENISLLTFSESTLAIQDENESDEGKDLIASNLRVTDEARNRLNAYVMISPYAQCSYSAYLTIERPKDKPNLSFLFKHNPYHLDFLLSNIILSIFVIFAGTNIFKRQNI